MNLKTLFLLLVVGIACGLFVHWKNTDNKSAQIPVPTPANADEFNSLFEGASTRQRPLIMKGDMGPMARSSSEIKTLRQCILDFEACLRFKNDHWQSMVFMAKSYQALGEHETALDWLVTAANMEKNNHVIYKEASLQSVLLGNIEKAIEYSSEGLRIQPDDPVLLGNHAMNLLIGKRDEQALSTIKRAIEIAPEDQFNQRCLKIISEVLAGKRERPKCELSMKL